MDTQQTIVALAVPTGPAARAIVRLSGADVRTPLQAILAVDTVRGGIVETRWTGVPISVYFWPGPNSYTGQDVAELHLVGCPPLVDELMGQLIGAGCRAAGPGEFTQRAFLAGKLDLTRAEAVHAVIAAESRSELRAALGQLAGGLAAPLVELRSQLLDLLADLEAGLDFADEDIEFVTTDQLLTRLGMAMARVTLVQKQIESRSLAGAAFRVALVGRPNAGKSSLFNALAGASALVSPVPGTTRDYLTARVILSGLTIELTDTPGLMEAVGLEAEAQSLGRKQLEAADLLLVCIESAREPDAEEQRLLRRPSLRIATKCDLGQPSSGLATSAATLQGLDPLRAAVVDAARSREEPPLASSMGRCRGHVAAALGHLRAAHELALDEGPAELTALELRLTLEELGQMAGAVYTDDLLDRVFARFCIGK